MDSWEGYQEMEQAKLFCEMEGEEFDIKVVWIIFFSSSLFFFFFFFCFSKSYWIKQVLRGGEYFPQDVTAISDCNADFTCSVMIKDLMNDNFLNNEWFKEYIQDDKMKVKHKKKENRNK